MWIKGSIFLYVALIVLSPALRIPGVQGMRGVAGDHVLLIVLLAFFFLISSRKFFDAAVVAFKKKGGLAQFYFGFTIISIVAVAFRLLADTAAYAPLIEISRLYGFVRPALLMLLVSVLLKFYSYEPQENLLNIFQVAILIFGGLSIALGVLQGLGYLEVDLFLTTYYSRDVNFDDVLKYGRAYATFDGQPNVFGTFCGLYVLLALARIGGVWSALLLGPLVILGGVGLMFSGSRGAMLGMFLGLLFWIVLSRNLKAVFVVSIGLLCGVLVINLAEDLVPASLINRLTLNDGGGTGAAGIAETRLPYWNQISELLQDNPVRWIFGVPGNLMPPTDNLHLALIASVGIPGFIVFMFLLISLFRAQIDNQHFQSRIFLVVLVFLFLNGTSYPTYFSARIGDLFWMWAAFVSFSWIRSGKVAR